MFGSIVVTAVSSEEGNAARTPGNAGAPSWPKASTAIW
jgi:hypothetical protein